MQIGTKWRDVPVIAIHGASARRKTEGRYDEEKLNQLSQVGQQRVDNIPVSKLRDLVCRSDGELGSPEKRLRCSSENLGKRQD